MGDEEDAFALFREGAHGGHQLVDLLRGEDGRRLVEYEYLVVAVKHFQYFNALLHTNGDVLDLGVKIHLETVFFGKLKHPAARFLLLEEAEFGGFRAEYYVVEHRENIDELEVLVYHAYAEGCRVVRACDVDRLAVFAYFAGLRLIQTEEHAHKS